MNNASFDIDTLRSIGAIWQYAPGSPVHAELTSGLHSNLFLNMSRLIERPRVLASACEALLAAIRLPEGVRFVGSAMGGITIAHECARTGGTTMAYTEKTGGAMNLSRFSLEAGEQIVLVEDVLTTGGTTRKTWRACAETGAGIVPVILTIINRSGMDSLSSPLEDGAPSKIISLVQARGNDYLSDACPMCKEGSVAKRPKANWADFAAHHA